MAGGVGDCGPGRNLNYISLTIVELSGASSLLRDLGLWLLAVPARQTPLVDCRQVICSTDNACLMRSYTYALQPPKMALLGLDCGYDLGLTRRPSRGGSYSL
jgi:hypothetical protein